MPAHDVFGALNESTRHTKLLRCTSELQQLQARRCGPNGPGLAARNALVMLVQAAQHGASGEETASNESRQPSYASSEDGRQTSLARLTRAASPNTPKPAKANQGLRMRELLAPVT